MRTTHQWFLAISIFLFMCNTPAFAEPAHMKNGHHVSKHHYQKGGHGKEQHKASCWMSSLTDEQKAKAATKRLEFKKVESLLMAKMAVKKVELATLVTQDSPDQSAINNKIDEILALKKEKLQKKYAFKVDMRKMLTPEQRVLFDKQLFKKVLHGKGHGRHKKH